MKELYLATESGNIKINQDQIEKYNLVEGGISPYTKCRIVDKNGEYNLEANADEKSVSNKPEMPRGEGLEDDEITEFPDGQIFSQSEIIDFSEGTDSSVEGNKDE